MRSPPRSSRTAGFISRRAKPPQAAPGRRSHSATNHQRAVSITGKQAGIAQRHFSPVNARRRASSIRAKQALLRALLDA